MTAKRRIAGRSVREAMRSQRWQLTTSVLAIIASAAVLVPWSWSWWRQGARLADEFGWRWFPLVQPPADLGQVEPRSR
ncbi:hypothetical protein AB0M54_37305 [Actinoplanes sp. NPDC051470]|uniref:hypothetical protein n=1 Tax=unclassified Actinoplanes TaxID=2626549 RepID=UPI00342021F4